MSKDKILNLAKDLARGKVQNFSLEESNETLRNAFKDLMEFTDEDNGGISRKTLRRHKTEIFEILEEIINETLQEGLRDQFSGFAEYRHMAWGDTNKFTTPSHDAFRVALVSDGNANLRRQRLTEGQEFFVDLDTYAIKIGEDFHRFLAGRVQWADLMANIAVSFQRDLTYRIFDAVMRSYGDYNTKYHWSGTLTEDQLIVLAMHIEARTNESVVVYGTKLALRQLAPSSGMLTDEMRTYRNRVGYYGEIAGIELREIQQSHKYGKDEFAIDNNMLLVLPSNAEKMVKVVNEGDAIIQDHNGGVTSDMMAEYFIANKFGVGIITSKVFGFIKLAGAGSYTEPVQTK